MAEETVIEVLTEEMMQELGQGIQMDIVVVQENIGEQSLTKLTPLIVEFNKLKPYENLVWDAEKDNSQDYTDAWKHIRSFRASVKETKKVMKQEILETGKALDSIEKSFVDAATKIMEKLEKNFQPYLEEKERKKKEAEERKNAARQAEIDAAKEEADKEMLKARKMGAFNAIKYDTVYAWKDQMSKAIATWNKETLEANLMPIGTKKLDELAKQYGKQVEFSLLEDHEVLEIGNLLKGFRNELVAQMENAIEKLDAVVAAPAPTPPPADPVAAPAEVAPPGPPPSRPQTFRETYPNCEVVGQNIIEAITYFRSLASITHPTRIQAKLIGILDSLESAETDIQELLKM